MNELKFEFCSVWNEKFPRSVVLNWINQKNDFGTSGSSRLIRLILESLRFIWPSFQNVFCGTGCQTDEYQDCLNTRISGPETVTIQGKISITFISSCDFSKDFSTVTVPVIEIRNLTSWDLWIIFGVARVQMNLKRNIPGHSSIGQNDSFWYFYHKWNFNRLTIVIIFSWENPSWRTQETTLYEFKNFM